MGCGEGLRGEEANCLGYGRLEDAGVDGRVCSAMGGEDLAECKEGGEISSGKLGQRRQGYGYGYGVRPYLF